MTLLYILSKSAVHKKTIQLNMFLLKNYFIHTHRVHGGGGMSRIKTCQGYHDRINPLSGSCETLGTQGSCGDLEIFVGNEETNPEDRTYGHCECDYERYAQPLVSVGGQCHFLYTQVKFALPTFAPKLLISKTGILFHITLLTLYLKNY